MDIYSFLWVYAIIGDWLKKMLTGNWLTIQPITEQYKPMFLIIRKLIKSEMVQLFLKKSSTMIWIKKKHHCNFSVHQLNVFDGGLKKRANMDGPGHFCSEIYLPSHWHLLGIYNSTTLTASIESTLSRQQTVWCILTTKMARAGWIPPVSDCWLAAIHSEFRGQTFLISLSGEKVFCLLVVKLLQWPLTMTIFPKSQVFSRDLSNVNTLSLLLSLLLYYLKELIFCCTAVYYCGSVDRIICLFHPLSKWDK